MQFTVTSDFEGERLDVFLAFALKDYSRSQIKKMFEKAAVSVNGKNILKASFRLQTGFVVSINRKEETSEFKPIRIDLDVIFEDDDVLLINKPFNLLVHPVSTALNFEPTLVHALLSYLGPDILDIGNPLRPGIVHRLDKDTSGIMIIPKTQTAYDNLLRQFSKRIVKKSYESLVSGILKHKKATIDAPIIRNSRAQKMQVQESKHSKDSITHYFVMQEFADASLLDVILETGRTHQIRVHLASIGHPVLGDKTYGYTKVNKFFEEKYGLKRQFLHAKSLSFIHPTTKKELRFEAPLALDLNSVLDQLTPLS